MLISDAHIGMNVYFGRPNGEKTLGEIVKINPAKAKVKTLESRGKGRGSHEGVIWSVPYSLMTPANGEATPAPREVLDYSPFDSDNLLLEALLQVYTELSPENLTCDGELSMPQVQFRRRELERKRKGIIMALGRDVDETAIYEWYHSKVKYEGEQAAASKKGA